MSRNPGGFEARDTSVAAPAGRKPVDLSDLLPRALSGIVLVAVAVTATLSGGIPFAILWWLAAMAIHWEWQRMLGPARLLERLSLGGLGITAADLVLQRGHGAVALGLLGVSALGVTALAGRSTRAFAGGGVVYAGLLPLALALLRSSDRFGADAVFWLFAVVWGTDVFAYFGGRLIGGPKLWPRVSPSKTWSGFLVGVGSGALAGWLASFAWAAHWALIPLGVAAGMTAQAGDLFESSLKRRFGIKDSSRIIPGHGGVLDRLDGFLAATLFAVGFGMLRFGAEASAAGLLQW